MRLTGKRELERLYSDLEGADYTPSISYLDLIEQIKKSRIYISSLSFDMKLNGNNVKLTLYRDYPEIMFVVNFTKL